MPLSVQEAIAARTEEALEDFLTSIRRMPPDKLDWRPLGEGRSALDQLQECTTAPLFYLAVIQRTEFVSQREICKTWDAAECERRAQAATSKLVAAIRAVPDEELQTKIDVPKNGIISILDVLWMHLANLTYHLGAVNFIQTLYGDLEME